LTVIGWVILVLHKKTSRKNRKKTRQIGASGCKTRDFLRKVVVGTGFEPVFWVFRFFLIPAYLEHFDRINTLFIDLLG
jgi:hypothetical protein